MAQTGVPFEAIRGTWRPVGVTATTMVTAARAVAGRLPTRWSTTSSRNRWSRAVGVRLLRTHGQWRTGSRRAGEQGPTALRQFADAMTTRAHPTSTASFWTHPGGIRQAVIRPGFPAPLPASLASRHHRLQGVIKPQVIASVFRPGLGAAPTTVRRTVAVDLRDWPPPCKSRL